MKWRVNTLAKIAPSRGPCEKSIAPVFKRKREREREQERERRI